MVSVNLLGAADENHFVYEAVYEPFSGRGEPGHVIERSGSSSLYLQSVNGDPLLVDTSVAGFSLKSFLQKSPHL